jgi:hypothetical protein
MDKTPSFKTILNPRHGIKSATRKFLDGFIEHLDKAKQGVWFTSCKICYMPVGVRGVLILDLAKLNIVCESCIDKYKTLDSI